MGLSTVWPKRTSLVTEPPRWLMPLISLFFTSKPVRTATSARMSEALSTPWPPRPATTTLVSWLGIGFLRFAFATFQFPQPLYDEEARAAGNDDAQFPARETFIQHPVKIIHADARLD